FCITGGADADDALDDCAGAGDEFCGWLLADGACVGAGDGDCAFAEITGKNATSSTAASGRPEWRQASRKILLVETGTDGAFERHNLIVVSGRQ
ncbi:MAG: hypothetical protein WAN97_01340, partial [Candidatus Acidiferrales bacterium]